MSSVRGGAITGWGTALPERVVTNHDLEMTMDTSEGGGRALNGVGGYSSFRLAGS